MILGTKVGREMYNNDYDGPNRPEGLSLYKIRRHAEGSLQRLQTDHIELYQMHNVDRSVNWDELWRRLRASSVPARSIMSARQNLPAGSS